MNMSNTTPGILARAEDTKATKTSTWQELVPLLRTGDVITVYNNQGEPERDARVWVSNTSPLITAGERHPRYLRFADGTFNEHVTDVVLQRTVGRDYDLEPLAASLKAGDVVRATFVYAESPVINLEGTVDAERHGDTFLAVEDEDGTPGYYNLTLLGRLSRSLRALEVIDPAEDTEDTAPLTFADYAARAAETAVYPGQGTFWGLQYVTAGLSSEAGEVLGKITKMQRDGGYTPESSNFWGGDRDDLIAELGDVAWYLAMACLEADINPDDVLTRNLSKLADRAARDTIHGSGDNR